MLFTVAMVSSFEASASDDEVSLFDESGKAVAYIALDDELTIYLWGGKPVAYLERDSQGGYHVYGFNGTHLGWFVGGVIRDLDRPEFHRHSVAALRVALFELYR